MCLIVDANRCTEFFKEPKQEYAYVRDCLFGIASRTDIKVKLVVGGHLKTELLRNPAAKLAIATLIRGNRARLVSDDKVDDLTAKLKLRSDIESDDWHVLALALISNARLLISEDGPLVKDFTNASIISPPGKVYRDRSHDHLLVVCCSKDLPENT